MDIYLFIYSDKSHVLLIIPLTVRSAQLLVDPDRAQPTAGESLNLTCYFTGRLNGTEGQMRWLKNGVELVATNVTESGGRRAVLQLDGLAPSHSGVYTCEMMMVDDVMLQASAHVTVTGRSTSEKCMSFDTQLSCSQAFPLSRF